MILKVYFREPPIRDTPLVYLQRLVIIAEDRVNLNNLLINSCRFSESDSSYVNGEETLTPLF